MPAQPTRRKIEPGVYERLGPDGRRVGLEVVWKADGRTHRRAVAGATLADARDALAQARTRRVERQVEPTDVRTTFAGVADAFERAHVASLRPNSRRAYGSALARLRAEFGDRRITAIGKLDVRAFIAAETAEGLKASTITGHLKALSAVFTFARDDLGIPVTMPRLKPSERPRADEGREQRVLTDAELAKVLDACPEHARLYVRTVAETGARASEVLGLTAPRIGDDSISFVEQLADDGTLAPLKTRQSRRTIEVTRGLAAKLKLAAAPSGRVFEHLALRRVERAWANALDRAGLADPQPRLHDLRHTHVSGLIADGWDVVEVAGRIGDTLPTTLKTYSHAFDARRRSARRREALEARYGDGMATFSPSRGVTERDGAEANIPDLQAIRDSR